MENIDIHLHAMVTHFPIALFVSALVMEVASLIFKKDSLHRTARHLYVLAVLVTPFVVKTGLWEDAEYHMKHPVMERHETLGLATMWVSVASLPILWLFEKKIAKYFRLVFIVFLLLVATTVTLTAYNGGRLVFEYGVGIEEE